VINSTDLVLRLIDAFDRVGVSYMLVGSYSSNYYGRPRSTKDADFVVQIDASQFSAVCAALGAEFKVDPQMSFESVTMTMRYIIEHPETAFKIELFLLSADPHDNARFSRKTNVDFEGRQAWLPSVEDVIVTKLRWSKGGRRAKDVEDVKNVLSLRSASIDLAYIRQWADQHGTRELFERLLAQAQGHI
jgi:hypothetical protein